MSLKQELESELEQLVSEEIRLIEKRSALESEGRLIIEQIRQAKISAFRGNYSDPTWFRATETKANNYTSQIKDINVKLQLLEKRISRVNLKLKTIPPERNVTKDQLFIQVTKENVSTDVYRRIWDIVEGRLMTANQND